MRNPAKDNSNVHLEVTKGRATLKSLIYMLQGVKYNIPVAIWLPEKYPRAPPIVYVVPTQDMMIKPRHSFVTPSGVVNSAYVQNWNFRCGSLQSAAVNFCTNKPVLHCWLCKSKIHPTVST